MSASPYENYRYPREVCQKGGRNRAKSAKRDKLGRFLPRNGTLPEPQKHGVNGCKARANTAKRDSKGRFIKAN